MRGACCEGVHCSCGAGYVWERCRRSNINQDTKWIVSYVSQMREEQMVRICLYICTCMCGSAHDCGGVVNAMVAS